MKNRTHKRALRLASLLLAAAMLTTLFGGLTAFAEESDGLTIQNGGYLYRKTSTAPSPNEVKLVQYPVQIDYTGYSGSLEIPSVISEDVLGFPVNYAVTELAGTEGSFPGALEGVRLSSVTLPGTLESIGKRAMADTAISSLTFPTSVTSLAADAFVGTALSALTLDVVVPTTLKDGASYTTSRRATPLQLPIAVTGLSVKEPLTVTGSASLSGDVQAAQKITVSNGASLTLLGSLEGSGAIEVANQGSLVLQGSADSYRGQITLAGAASTLENRSSSPVRFINASGNASIAQSGETVSGGHEASNPNDPTVSAAVRPKITMNDGGTVAVRSSGRVVVITAFSGYHVEDVVINGLSMGGITRYEFQQASSDNTVEVTFAAGDSTEGPSLPDNDPIFVFKDVDLTAWYVNAVSFMVNNKIFVGVSKDRFAPKDQTTRAMFVTLLHRLDGYDDKYNIPCDSPAPLTDIRKGSWYADAAQWAVGTGVSPISGTKFQPGSIITREEIAVYLYNFTKALGGDVEANEGVLDGYSDKDQIAPDARLAVAWAATNGYLSGRSTDQLEPHSSAMRSEIAEILMRYLTANAKIDFTPGQE